MHSMPSITLLYFKRSNLIPLYKHSAYLYGLFELELHSHEYIGIVSSQT